MSPLIKDGDILTVSPLFRSAPALGEVVAFTDPLTGRLLVHRVIAKKGQAYLIKGDRVRGPDGVIGLDNILGRLTGIERDRKTIRFGLGPERLIILLLCRMSSCLPLLCSLGQRIRSSFGKALRG